MFDCISQYECYYYKGAKSHNLKRENLYREEASVVVLVSLDDQVFLNMKVESLVEIVWAVD